MCASFIRGLTPVLLMLFAGVTASAQAVVMSTDSRPGLISRYCVTCHSSRLHTAGLVLEKLDLSHVEPDAATWEKVALKLRAGAMPPPGLPRPDAASRLAFVRQIESRLDAAAAVNPVAGRPAIHRLNRAEYRIVMRDLLAVDIDVKSLLPADDSSFGFDNIADVLNVSPALVDRYMDAAAKIAALAVGDPDVAVTEKTYPIRSDVTQTHHIGGLPLGTRGGVLIRETFQVDGEYTVIPELWRTNVGFIRGLSQRHEVEVSIDGVRVHLASVGAGEDYVMSLMKPEQMRKDMEHRLQVTTPVRAGPRSVAVSFIERSHALAPNLLQPFDAVFDPVDSDGIPQLASVTIRGPYHPHAPSDTPSRRRIFICDARTGTGGRNCAMKILSLVARRAYRRPIEVQDVQPLMRFYDQGFAQAGFDQGIELALVRVLVDPEFLFRMEHDVPDAIPGRSYRITDLELASRLSFFLWSSIPDAQLLSLAERHVLSRPDVLEQQVHRMLRDPRSAALVHNFGGQWLHLRNLDNVLPNRDEFPDFDDNLREAMRRETELLLNDVIRDDRSVVDLLTSENTYVNDRLARHYGIPDIYGSHFRAVHVQDDARRGILGQASLLTVTSYPNRTSPVLRGKWVLENVLGTPPSPPPPDVPALTDNSQREKPMSMRQQMEQHRANAVCASCHRFMDPIGFALENFDAVGAWRKLDSGAPVDSRGELVDGSKFEGPAGLRQVILNNSDVFVRTLTAKLMTYALGRGTEYYDMPAVRAIASHAQRQDYKWSALVFGIVTSVPFEMRTAPAAGSSVARSAGEKQ